MGMSREEFMAMIQKKKDAAKGKGGDKGDAKKKGAKDSKDSKDGKKESTSDRLKKLPFSRVKMKK